MEVEILSRGTINEQYLDDIAVAINTKLGSSSTMTPSEMAAKIGSIHTASDVHLGAGSFSANGVYPASSDNLDGYNTVAINVPNTYSADDEGKVVSNGALVGQTTITVNQNTGATPLNTTTISQVTVNVANSYSAGDNGKVVQDNVLVVQTSSTITENIQNLNTTTISQVTVNVPTGGGSDYYPFSGTDVDNEIDTYCDEIYSSTGSTTFYTTYSNRRINTLNINASTTGSNIFYYLNSTTNLNQVLFNKLVIASGITLSASCYSGHTDIKEVVIEGKLNGNTEGYHFKACSMLKKADMSKMTGASSGSTPGSGNVMHNSFQSCTTLKQIILPSDVTALGDEFADGCYSLKDINTDNIIKLNGKVFQNCYSLQKLNLNNLTHLGTLGGDSSIFQNSGIEEINLPNLIEWLASSTFSNCKNLRKVISLGTQITSIPSNSFQQCINLKTVPIPNTVTSIGYSAFQGCKALKNIIIPTEVTTIGGNAFYDCISLDWIQFLSTNPPNVQYSSTFQNIPTTCKIYVPSGTLNAYTSASNYPSSSTYTYIEGSPPST